MSHGIAPFTQWEAHASSVVTISLKARRQLSPHLLLHQSRCEGSSNSFRNRKEKSLRYDQWLSNAVLIDLFIFICSSKYCAFEARWIKASRLALNTEWVQGRNKLIKSRTIGRIMMQNNNKINCTKTVSLSLMQTYRRSSWIQCPSHGAERSRFALSPSVAHSESRLSGNSFSSFQDSRHLCNEKKTVSTSRDAFNCIVLDGSWCWLSFSCCVAIGFGVSAKSNC